MSKSNNSALPIAIIVGSIIIGGFLYASQANKQRSIEKQQELKAKREKKEYVAKRKMECYSLYEKERDKWSNVVSSRYSETRDVCVIKYKSNESAKSKEECEKIIENTSEASKRLINMLFESYSDCLENWFSKEF